MLGKEGVCHPLKHTYDIANLTLVGQASAVDESYTVETDVFGVPTVTHKFDKTDVPIGEKSDKVFEIERRLASKRLRQLIADNPDVIPELDEGSDGEENPGHSDEDPDVPREMEIATARGTRKVMVDRHDTMITAKTPRKIPLYTNAEWREIPPATQVIMLGDYDRRQKRKRIRGVRGDWAGLSEDERQEVRLHFDRLQEERRAQMEAAMPAPDHDWGIGICDLNVKQFEKRLQKFERGEKPQSEDCAIAAENPAAGKARGRNRQATRNKTIAPVMPCKSRKGGAEGHRPKIGSVFNLHDLGIPAMVARPVSKDEMKRDNDANGDGGE